MIDKDMQDLLILSLYGELSDQEQKELDRLLSEREDLRREMALLQRLHQTLDEGHLRPPTHLLWQSRQQLSEALLTKPPAPSRPWMSFVVDWLSPSAPLARALTSLVLVTAGLAIGFLMFANGDRSRVGFDPFEQPGVRLSGVQFSGVDQGTGQVAVTFEATRTFQFKGPIDDERILRFLAFTLINDHNPGARLQAVNTIGNQLKTRDDLEIQNALIGALKTDTNPAVRREALQALKGYPSGPQIKQALLYVLRYDSNARIRIEAINLLESWSSEFDQETLEVLREKVQSDQNDYIRRKAETVLIGVGKEVF
jgi:hypothetical protein